MIFVCFTAYKIDFCSIRVALIDRVAPAEPVQVLPARVANWIAVHELAGAGVVVAVRQAQQARFRVRVVPILAPEACWVTTLLEFTLKELPAAGGRIACKGDSCRIASRMNGKFKDIDPSPCGKAAFNPELSKMAARKTENRSHE